MSSRYEQFAEQWLRTGDPMLAAIAMGMSGSEAFTVARDWPNNLDVLTAKDDLLAAHGPEYFLPSKHDQARAVWQKAQNTADADDFAKLMRLYAEIMGNLAPKQENKSGAEVVRIVFESIQAAPVKPAINVTPERLQIEKVNPT